VEDAKRPNIKLKFRAGLSSSPPQLRDNHSTESSPSTMKFRAIEIPAQQPHNGWPPNQGPSLKAPMESPPQATNRPVPSPYLQHAASNTLNGHSAPQTSQSPNTRPTSSSVYLNGSHEPQTTYPYPSNPPHHQSTAPPVYANGHAFNTFQVAPQQSRGSRPASGHASNQYLAYGAHQPLNVSQPRSLPTDSTPQPRPIINQTPYGAVPTPSSQHQGRLPSPILNRPSMSPTQGNPDVGPVAGVPERSPAGTAMSPPPSQPTPNQVHNPSINQPHNSPHQSPPYQNGESNLQFQYTNINHSQNPHQHHHLSGLSPTKHSPNLQPPGQPTSRITPSPSPYPLSATGPRGRSVSGTPIFPPTEMLQPSPRQLSKSPVPTPSKGMTPASLGEGELKRITEEIRGRVEEVGMGEQNGEGV
jgi:hypothetical protein